MADVNVDEFLRGAWSPSGPLLGWPERSKPSRWPDGAPPLRPIVVAPRVPDGNLYATTVSPQFGGDGRLKGLDSNVVSVWSRYADLALRAEPLLAPWSQQLAEGSIKDAWRRLRQGSTYAGGMTLIVYRVTELLAASRELLAHALDKDLRFVELEDDEWAAPVGEPHLRWWALDDRDWNSGETLATLTALRRDKHPKWKDAVEGGLARSDEAASRYLGLSLPSGVAAPPLLRTVARAEALPQILVRIGTLYR